MMPLSGEEFDWDSLLDYIVARDTQVIPVIGKELLSVPDNGGTIAREQHLARGLLGAPSVDAAGLTEPIGLNDAVLRCLKVPGSRKRHRIYSQLNTLANDPALPVPEPLSSRRRTRTTWSSFTRCNPSPGTRACATREAPRHSSPRRGCGATQA